MSTDLEQRIRAASPPRPPELDLGVLHDRATALQRIRRRRRRSSVVAIVGVLGVGLLGSLLVSREEEQPARRVDTAVPEVTWQRLPGIDGQVSDVVTAGGVTVAVGSVGSRSAVWTSPDGVTWSQVYAQPPSQVDQCDGSRCTTQDVRAELHRVTYANGRFVAIGDTDGPDAVRRGVALASTDGAAWTATSPEAFDPARAPKSNLGTMLRDVAWFDGAFVVTGDIYTANRRQMAGLSPALWRSRDGVHWSRRILDLGDGFDPFMTELAVKDGLLVAGGGYRHGFGAWTTRDLRSWSFHLIDRRGGQRIVAVPSGFVAAGGTCVPATLCGQPRPKTQPRTRPTLWFSPDAVHWRVVLRLAVGTMPESAFGPVGVVGDTLVALGARTTGHTTTQTTSFAYVSPDGRTWLRDRDATVFPEGTTFSGSGSRGSSFLVFGWPNAGLWIASP